MAIYNTTILVAGIQLLVLLDDQTVTESRNGVYIMTARTNRSFSEQVYGYLYYSNNYVTNVVDTQPYIIQSIINNSLVGTFSDGGCTLQLADITNTHLTYLSTAQNREFLSTLACLQTKAVFSELKQKEYTTQIADLQTKLADLEKRTNYVENNRAWW